MASIDVRHGIRAERSRLLDTSGSLRLLLAIAFAASVAACATTPHWIGEGLHEVDGYLVTSEEPCPLPPADAECGEAVAAAIGTLSGESAARVVKAATADSPRAYVNEKGETILPMTGGIAKFIQVVLDFSDGTRRAIPVFCPSGYPLRDCEFWPEGGIRSAVAPSGP